MSFVIKSTIERAEVWGRQFAEHLPDIPFRIWPDIGDPAEVEYLATWVPPEDLVERFPNLKVLFSVGAGIDQFDLAAIPPHIKIVRMIETGLTEGMVAYVQFAVRAIQRDMLRYASQQRAHVWQAYPVREAARFRVGVMGLGQLGVPVAYALRDMGYVVQGWARSAREIDKVQCFADEDGLRAFLASTDILICLLPLTAETTGILNHDLFAQLPRGASLVQCGRGRHLVTDDLIAALDSGQLASAILDVTDPEPLPADHPLWDRTDVLITPHIASMTPTESGGMAIVENIRRYRNGEAPVGLVDRRTGY
ncbi:glyoxylate/hydroxypyruvate reductase A [Komagataeibacter xylinus]|uniref:Glyoxylate/hydroxypyruvate reductase A n=1 Tax=Komagataeibacter xylinus TaxID=28448 RepID=A0A318PG71_KOMXY|nr:glyoxylate/hydroxypyruvate reductase A [Komagataeibacter xylinus]PYD55994.1 glyoxylate/hydroxypyruvate reductase A [Komagataeibacter xylinus]GBQ77948.1 D-3-phosphoglycerate dehydrogenase [Komagataeibacter xylinus NBRC 15237]